MITQMDRYIARHVTGAICVVLVVLTLLSSSFTLLAEMGNLRMQYHLWQAIQFVLASMPGMLLQVFPVSVLIGCMAGLGILAGNNELVIMQVSGMSRFKICLAAIKPGIILIIASMLLGEFIVPKLQYQAEQKRKVERYLTHAYSENGVWWRHGNSYIHIGNITNNQLNNIDIFVFDHQHQLQKTITAGQAVKKNGHWQLQDTQTVRITPEKNIKTVSRTLQWDIPLDSDLLKIATTEPDLLSVRNLVTYIGYMKKQHLDARSHELSLYKKLFEPVTIISLLLIGISFIFGPLRSVSMGFRLFTGVSAGVIFMLLQNLMTPVSIVLNFTPVLAVLFPAFLCIIIALFLLRRS